MSMRTLPLVFINLGGEMLYILDQRLRAQNTADDNTQKVMNDIVATMFNKAFMEELLKPQDLYSHGALRRVLTRLAHASIMRLNPASMDRLYELMVMAFKYQLLLCPRPRDLLIISYNHIDTIRECTHPCLMGNFNSSDKRFSYSFKTCMSGMFSSNGKEWKRWEFPTGGSYTSSIRVGSFERFGDRVIRIGTNMYSVTQPEETHTSENYSQKNRNTETGFQVNLFDTDQEEEAGASGGNGDQSFEDVQVNTELARIAGEFTGEPEQTELPEGPSNKGDDLLAMMDELIEL
ncbi:unnamed protein product [Coregonus sp. 'balchen']|nr:unnamed protein product [Coregonus sp. 'balchen']